MGIATAKLSYEDLEYARIIGVRNSWYKRHKLLDERDSFQYGVIRTHIKF